VDSPVGPILLGADGSGRLTSLRFGPMTWAGSRAGTGAGTGKGTSRAAAGVLDLAAVQLGEYFDGRRREFDLPLGLAGTPFQLAVWHALLGVGFGTTVSYGRMAEEVGRPGASRAVGHANARNPVAVIVPCHRVVGAGGSLTGYGGGLEAKRLLLDLEARVVASP
jgi:methylated-DNA-[protein]-cysteine S-methyltransferase